MSTVQEKGWGWEGEAQVNECSFQASRQGCKNFQVGPEPWANMCTCAVPSLFRTVLCFSKSCQSLACVHAVPWWESIKVLRKEASSAVRWPDIEEVGGGKRRRVGDRGLWKVSGDSVSSIRSRSNDLSGRIFGLSSSWSYLDYHLSSLYRVQYCCLVKSEEGYEMYPVLFKGFSRV